MPTKSLRQQNNLFRRMQNPFNPSLKIHTHLFYANHLGEPGGYKSSEKLNIDAAWKSGTNLTKRLDGGLLPLWVRIPVKKISKNRLFNLS